MPWKPSPPWSSLHRALTGPGERALRDNEPEVRMRLLPEPVEQRVLPNSKLAETAQEHSFQRRINQSRMNTFSVKLFTTIIGLLAFSHSLHATPQVGDKLVIEDHVVYVHYFALNEEYDAKIRKIESERDYYISSTANHDGFYAALELKDRKLYLTHLWIDGSTGSNRGRQPVPLSTDGNSPAVFAEWFSGDLIHYHGQQLGYTHERSRMVVMTFKHGVLMKMKDIPVTLIWESQDHPDEPSITPNPESEIDGKPIQELQESPK